MKYSFVNHLKPVMFGGPFLPQEAGKRNLILYHLLPSILQSTLFFEGVRSEIFSLYLTCHIRLLEGNSPQTTKTPGRKISF